MKRWEDFHSTRNPRHRRYGSPIWPGVNFPLLPLYQSSSSPSVCIQIRWCTGTSSITYSPFFFVEGKPSLSHWHSRIYKNSVCVHSLISLYSDSDGTTRVLRQCLPSHFPYPHSVPPLTYSNLRHTCLPLLLNPLLPTWPKDHRFPYPLLFIEKEMGRIET